MNGQKVLATLFKIATKIWQQLAPKCGNAGGLAQLCLCLATINHVLNGFGFKKKKKARNVAEFLFYLL